jgi:hypothetical protein
MSQVAIEKLLGRLLTDDVFRHRAMNSLATACREEGLDLSEEELRVIDPDDLVLFELISGRLDSNIKRFSLK